MRIAIVGAGQVGASIAASIAADHDVTVVDRDAETVEGLTYTADVLAVEGDGTSRSTLLAAGVDEADIVVASTDDDETNLVVCGLAKTLGETFTIARVRNAEYLEAWTAANGAFGVDFMVSTDLLTALDIVRVVGLPSALDVDPFVSGLVQMAEFEVDTGSELAGETVASADRFEALTFVALVRNGSVVIPRGETVVTAGDKVIVIGRPESVRAFSEVVSRPSEEADDFVIAGGSAIGYHVARLLGERGLRPRLIERDHDRARELAEALRGTVVLEPDATDVDFLAGEGIDQVDAVIAATDSDEKNLLISLLAKNMGVRRTVALVAESQYAALFEKVGIDVAINPREATAEEIVRFTQEGRIENLSLIEGRQAEVLEVEVDSESVLVGRPIHESVADLPDGVVIGAIIRAREFVVPRGGTVIEPGDNVVVFVAEDALGEVIAAI